MTRQEFSDTFTTMLNSHNTQAQFGEQASRREIVLDEYEKSVLLTQAQDIVTKSYFDGTLNQQGQGFDDSTRRQIDFSSLIKVAELVPFDNSDNTAQKFDERGILFEVPNTVLYILNEQLVVKNALHVNEDSGEIDEESRKAFVIVPINFKEYDREMSKPYAQPLKKQAWRLFQDKGTSNYDMITELIPKDGIAATPSYTQVGDVALTYKLRFIRRPQPIILEDLPNGLQIDGQSSASDCELNPIIHMDILNKAVELALATRGGGAPSQQQLQNSNRQ